MKSSIEIAQSATLRPIRTLVEELGLGEDDFESYGRYMGKIRLEALDRVSDRPEGKLILVTAMTPTPHGEGKTLTTIGLGQALRKSGRNAMIALREPSLGPVFGIKGGANGGGLSQVLPMEDINLHFTGDLHAISAAHNLLAAMLDNHLVKGNARGIDVTRVLWPRALDMNDRALRNVMIGLGGKAHGIPRESGFVITAASEIMAILALAADRPDLKRRLGEIAVAFDRDGALVRAAELNAQGAMAALLNKAIQPNLVQTLEHGPALVHAGPFANIAHGTNSVIADRIGLRLADYVVTEGGFGADLGAEKFFHIVARSSGLRPSAVVVVATCRALRHHGGADPKAGPDPAAVRAGLPNLETHVRNMVAFGVPVVVTINGFEGDGPEEIAVIRDACRTLEVPCVPHTAFRDGGAGALDLAEAAVGAAEGPVPEPRFLYPLQASVEEKVRTVATRVYGAADVTITRTAQTALRRFAKAGYGNLPICIAKTQSSLSDNPRALGAPAGWTLTVSDVRLSAGAGFLVLICGDMMLMPGLPAVPAAEGIDVDGSGRIHGLF